MIMAERDTSPEREAEIRAQYNAKRNFFGNVEAEVGDLLAMLDRERAEIDRLRAACAVIVAEWDNDEIGQIDGDLIDAIRDDQ
jgi:hypothetical protein